MFVRENRGPWYFIVKSRQVLRVIKHQWRSLSQRYAVQYMIGAVYSAVSTKCVILKTAHFSQFAPSSCYSGKMAFI